MKFRLAAVPLFFATCVASFASVITIDDFGQPNPAQTFFINALNPNPFSLMTNIGGGTARTLTVDVQGPSNPISANGFIGTISPGVGVLNVGTASNGPPSFTTLDYAFSPNLDLSASAYFSFGFDFLSMDSELDITVTTSGGTLTGTYTIPASSTVFQYSASFDFLSGTADLSNVTGLTFELKPPTDEDFELDTLAATPAPEPASFALISGGLRY